METPICAMCRAPVERFVQAMDLAGQLTFVCMCHGETQTVKVDLRTQFMLTQPTSAPMAFIPERRAL